MEEIIVNLDCFDIDNRNHILLILGDLMQGEPNPIVNSLVENKSASVITLLKKYEMPTMSGFVGQMLRGFTKFNVFKINQKLYTALLSIPVL
jgi:hypothetical protein